LSNKCNLIYDGRAMVGDAPRVYSGPFDIVLSDSSSPKKAVTIAGLLITVLHAPPDVGTVADVECPAGPGTCNKLVAEDPTGGIPPYEYTEGWGRESIGTGLPLGMHLVTIDSGAPSTSSFGNMSGDQAWLRSAPSRMFPNEPEPGTYPYLICVDDAVGFEACKWATVFITAPPATTTTTVPSSTAAHTSTTVTSPPPSTTIVPPRGTLVLEKVTCGVFTAPDGLPIPGISGTVVVTGPVGTVVVVSYGESSQSTDWTGNVEGWVERVAGNPPGATVSFTTDPPEMSGGGPTSNAMDFDLYTQGFANAASEDVFRFTITCPAEQS
jgi:hypothetical protein